MSIAEIYYQLRRDLPYGWVPEEILVTRLSFSYGVDHLPKFSLSDAVVYDYDPAVPTMDAFVAQLHSGNPPTPKPQSRAPVLQRARWLGVPIKYASVVVVILEGQTKWQFRASGPAITAKSDPRADTFGPRHYNAGGQPLPDHAPGAGCKVMAFAVVRRGKFEVQSFNFHLDLQQAPDNAPDPKWLEIAIDPDVPETGPDGFPFIQPPA